LFSFASSFFSLLCFALLCFLWKNPKEREKKTLKEVGNKAEKKGEKIPKETATIRQIDTFYSIIA
jgi:hypothetical protein